MHLTSGHADHGLTHLATVHRRHIGEEDEATITSAPRKLPKNTTIQFFQTADHLMRLLAAVITIMVLPVKSSRPQPLPE